MRVDNEALVAVVNNRTSRSENVMILIRNFVLICMKFNIIFKAKHIPGVHNSIADAISRKNFKQVHCLDPLADRCPQKVPDSFRQIICSLPYNG